MFSHLLSWLHNASCTTGRSGEYIAKINVKLSYGVYWQVVNIGEPSRQENGLRGTIFSGSTKHWKNPYTGKH